MQDGYVLAVPAKVRPRRTFLSRQVIKLNAIGHPPNAGVAARVSAGVNGVRLVSIEEDVRFRQGDPRRTKAEVGQRQSGDGRVSQLKEVLRGQVQCARQLCGPLQCLKRLESPRRATA